MPDDEALLAKVSRHIDSAVALNADAAAVSLADLERVREALARRIDEPQAPYVDDSPKERLILPFDGEWWVHHDSVLIPLFSMPAEEFRRLSPRVVGIPTIMLAGTDLSKDPWAVWPRPQPGLKLLKLAAWVNT